MPLESLLARTERGGTGETRLCKIEISIGKNYSLPNILVTGGPAHFAFYVTTLRAGLSCSFTIYDQIGQRVTYFDSALPSPEDCFNPEAGAKFLCEIDELPLLPGRYRINVAIMGNGEMQDHLEGAAFFEVEPGNPQGRPVSKQTGYCNVFVKHRWIKP
jgi:lipopolysaccharide transport system ATP-binding protein